MTTQVHRPAPSLSVLLLLVLPGCATRMLWTKGWEPRVVWQEQAADLRIEIAADQAVARALLLQARRVDGQRMPRGSGVAAERSQWRLLPRLEGEEGRALLAAPDGFLVRSAEVELRRDVRDGDIVCSDAQLRLHVTMDTDVVATRVEEAALPLATRRALRAVQASDLFLPAATDPVLPALLARCVERLANVDPTPLLGAGPATPSAVLVSYAWVDRDLCPVIGASRVQALCGDGLDDPSPLGQRLAKLAALRLLVVVVTGEGQSTFCLRPDFVWLWGAMANDGRGHLVHESRWHAVPLGGTGAEVALPQQVVAGTMRMRFFTCRYANDYLEKVIGKILATPFALALDILAALLRVDFEPVHEEERRRKGG